MRYKILFVNLFPHIGGAETSLLYLLEKLDKTRFEPIVIVPKPGYFSERLQQTHAKVLFLNLPGYLIRTLFIPGAHPKAMLEFYRLCKSLQPHLIHLNHLTQALNTGVVKRLFKIPVVATSWVDSDSIYVYQDLITHFFVDRILPITPELKKRMIQKRVIAEHKIQVIMPGVDTKYFQPPKDKSKAKAALGIKKSDIVITIASRFDPTKDHMTFLRSMTSVMQQVKNIKVLIAQDPNINLEDTNTSASSIKKEIDFFLKRHPMLHKRTTFIGYQNSMVSLYQATDILVSSSLYESLSLILIEASSCAVPIVSTNFGTQYHVVRDEKTGFLVPIQNPKKMAEKIMLLAENKRMREQVGKEARRHIIKHFSVKRYVQEIEKVYLSLL